MGTLLVIVVAVLSGLVLALLVARPVILPIFIRFLAERDLFFTLVEEGSAKAILHNGEFHRCVMAYRGYEFDANWNVVERNPHAPLEPLRAWMEKKFGGARWLGIPFVDTVYTYNFRWTVLRESRASEGEDGFVTQQQLSNGKWAVSFAKPIDYIYLRDAVYYVDLNGVETAELMPIDVKMLLPIRIMNPYKALFRVQKWLDATLDLIKPSIRFWVANQKFEDVIKTKKEVPEREYDTFLKTQPEKAKDAGASISEYLEKTYGVRVKRITFEDVAPLEKYTEAAVQRMAATQEAKKIATLRDAEYNRFTKITQAVKEQGEEGKLVFAGETIREASKGPATTIVLPFGALADFLRGLVGKKGD